MIATIDNIRAVAELGSTGLLAAVLWGLYRWAPSLVRELAAVRLELAVLSERVRKLSDRDPPAGA